MEKLKHEVGRYGQYALQMLLETVLLAEAKAIEETGDIDVFYEQVILISYYQKHYKKICLPSNRVVFAFDPAEAMALGDVLCDIIPLEDKELESEYRILLGEVQQYLMRAPWRVIHQKLELKHGTH